MKMFHPIIIGSLVFGLVATSGLACKKKKVGGHSCGHDHGSSAESASGHNHGVDDRAKVSQLRFSDTMEAFISFPVFMVGETSTIAIYLTRLADYQAVKEGTIEVAISGADGEHLLSGKVSDTPGLFNVDFKPSKPGKIDLKIAWKGEKRQVNMDLGTNEIYGDLESAVHAEVEGEPEGISFPKDQQLKNDFNTAKAELRPLMSNFEAYATVLAMPGMEGRMLAPATGRLEGKGFPSIGQSVRAGQRLGSLVPKGGSDLSMSSLKLELQRAEAKYALAAKDNRRMKALQEFGAVPLRQVEEAEKELEISQAEVRNAKINLSDASTGRGGLGLPLVSPASGIVSAAIGGPGLQVTEGQELFHIVDTRKLRLEVQVPEAHAPSLSSLSSVCFQAPGMAPIVFDASGKSDVRVLGAGGVVNADRRTVPFLLEFTNPGKALKVGHSGKAFIRWGSAAPVIAVPACGLQDEDGMNIVYTQIGGETFERRIVRVGARDGEWVQILSGLEAGERIVAKGAHLVRLAASKSKLPSHGCIH